MTWFDFPCLVRDGAFASCREPMRNNPGGISDGVARTAAKRGRGRLSLPCRPPAKAGSDRAFHTAEAGDSFGCPGTYRKTPTH